MSSKTEVSWWASRDSDYYTSGPHETREDAIFAGREDFEGEGFYVLEAAARPIRFCASRLIDDQYFESDDLFHADRGGPDRRGNSAAADAELQEMLDAWLTRLRDTFADPSQFAWSRNEEFIPAGAVGDQEAA